MAGNNKKGKSVATTKPKSTKVKPDAATEGIIQSVKSLPAEQQFEALSSHFSQLACELTQVKQTLTTVTSRCEAAEKSKDQLDSDYTKAMLSKSQLESLCRALQKQNKVTKEENLARIREEEEKRRDVSNRLNSTLADITGMMQQNCEKNTELRQENQNMASRLNDLVQQYESRQQNIDKVLQQKDLQLQLAEARLKKAEIEGIEGKEVTLKEKKTLLEDLQSYQEKITQMSAIEVGLREQLSRYSDSYDEFQKTVEASNTIMSKFKKEMELMTKKVKKLEKETLLWQTKWHKSQATLLDMGTERLAMQKQVDKLTKQNVKLQQLARKLADERKKLNSENDVAPSESPLEVEDSPDSAENGDSSAADGITETVPEVTETNSVSEVNAVPQVTETNSVSEVNAVPEVTETNSVSEVKAVPEVTETNSVSEVNAVPEVEEKCETEKVCESPVEGEDKEEPAEMISTLTNVTDQLTDFKARLAELASVVEKKSTKESTDQSAVEITEL